MNDLATIYDPTTDVVSTLYSRLQQIGDTYLINIAHIPEDEPNHFHIELLPFNNYAEPIKSDVIVYMGDMSEYCKLIETTILNLITQLPLNNAFPWEVCGVEGCTEVSVGPCLNHRK